MGVNGAHFEDWFWLDCRHVGSWVLGAGSGRPGRYRPASNLPQGSTGGCPSSPGLLIGVMPPVPCVRARARSLVHERMGPADGVRSLMRKALNFTREAFARRARL